ncbi:MAG: PAS domain-containing protein, partial [Bacteroidia bacterium]|nr:PAS domain-containing protein [Bacteroidia bacterium]
MLCKNNENTGMIKKLINNGAYQKIAENDLVAKQRYNLFWFYSIFGTLITALLSYQTFFIFELKGFIPFLIPILGVMYILNYAALQFHKQFKLAYFIVIFSTLSLVHILTYFSGGILNPGMFYLASVVLLAFMLLGTRVGRIIFALSCIHLIYFYFISVHTSWVTNIISEDQLTQDYLVTGIMGLLILVAQINYLEGSKNIVIQNITKSRNELEEKNIELKKLSLVASNTSNAVIICDKLGYVEWVNKSFTEMTQLSLGEINGKYIEQLYTGPSLNNQKIIALRECVKSNNTYEGELLKVRKDDSRFWAHIIATPILGDNNQMEKIVIIENDISEKKNSEEKLAEYLDSLEKTNKELEKFAYVVSHDLKAPLRAIGNLTGLIEHDAGDKFSSTEKNYFDLIKGRVKRMDSLINGLLNYSKAHRSRNKYDEVDVNKLVDEILEMLGFGNDVRIEIMQDLPVLLTDKVKLQQVFQNLISNAVKYNNKQIKTIAINAIEHGKFYKFSIQDNGPGIDEKFHGKIFEIFQTLNPRDTIESTGIGLTIVKKLVEEEGGKVSLESKAQEGATFSFTWP